MSYDSKIAIHVEDIHKEFILPQSKNSSFKEAAVNIVKKNNKVTQKTLDGVSFDIQRGDFFGIVGRNGSGKSTLLKLIAGVYTPTAGKIVVSGGLTPFIELGVGFNPELSGRDNIYLNGALLGFTRKQMSEMYEEIVDFAELGPFMDQKLKNYSSGMQVRLAFSIAIKAKNDILIFDEVLAVGDEAFQRKCLDVFERYKAEGQTVILVTHDMETVRKFCTKALLLESGKILELGHPHEVAQIYSELNLGEIEREMIRKSSGSSDNYLGLKVEYKDKDDESSVKFKNGEIIRMLFNYKKSELYQHLVINIYKQSGEHISGFRVAGESGSAEVHLRALLQKGKYYTLVQAVNNQHEAVGDVFIGPDFIITTDKAVGVKGWSGLVPLDYNIIKS
ncbi:MAG TPA: ABC transporter ATP-binding protein [Candidatus Saccharimonadales bacterium]|nr:ABC transporter ATP-binding protein [Candidatus Saccharimonadales bacterium]